MLTLITTAAFFGAYRVYVAALAPIMQSRVIEAPAAQDTTVTGSSSKAARSAAEKYLPGEQWASKAPLTFQRGQQAFLYFQEYQPIDDELKNKVQFKPFALILFDQKNPERHPFVLSADVARVAFQNKFKIGEDPGRIIGAALEKTVALRGPDGLTLDGSDFKFSEENHTLYSDEDLTMSFGPTDNSPSRLTVKGRGITLLLTPGTDELLGKDLPRIVDFEQLILRSGVEFDIHYDDHGKQVPVTIASDGPFEFRRDERLASFDENVVVTRLPENDQGEVKPETLNCHRLELRFDDVEGIALNRDEKKKSDAKEPSQGKTTTGWKATGQSLANLKFHFLRALGSTQRNGQPLVRAKLKSELSSLAASMTELQVDAAKRLLSINDATEAVIETASEDGISKLICRRLLAEVGADGKDLSWAVCVGPGQVQQIDSKTKEVILTADWKQRMEFRPESESPDADRVAELTGEVEIQSSHEAALWADHVKLWVPSAAFDRARRSDKSVNVAPMKRVTADGAVEFAAVGARGWTKFLDVMVERGIPPVMATAQKSKSPVSQAAGETPVEEEVPWKVSAGKIWAAAVIDPDAKKMSIGVRQVDAEGSVVISQAALPGKESEGATRIEGHRLTVVNKGGADQLITLSGTGGVDGRSGEPAHVQSGLRYLEGPKITVDRKTSKVKVVGQTLLRLPVESDFSGRNLASAVMMDIACRDGLTFDGKQGRFQKQVRVSLDESRMHCEELVATLDRPMDLRSPPKPKDQPRIEDIECLGRVKIEMREFDQRQFVRLLEANLGQFHVNLISGDFSGMGEGDVAEWRKGGIQIGIAPAASATANRPAESNELPWTYAHVNFKGQITGNINQQYGQINERVKVIYAPVEKVKVPFARDDLSKATPSAERAVAMDCDSLKILLTETNDQAKPFLVSLEAEGHALLEGQAVQAIAHQISYEQEKELLTLRGRGNEKANIFFVHDDGLSERNSVPGQTIQCNLTTRAVKIVDAGTFTGSN